MTNDSDGGRLVIVGGAPRSGTTLVQNMLDSHPCIFGGPEFLHLPHIIELRNRIQSSVAHGWLEGLCSQAEVDHRISVLIEGFFLPLLERNRVSLVSEKTPHNVLVFSELAQLLPKARFIHVIRDPRAIITSMLEVGHRGGKKHVSTHAFTHDLMPAIREVRQCFETGFSAARAAPDRFMTVRYEDLVQTPEEETRRWCVFLGLEWSPRMLTPAAQAHPGEQAITTRSREVWYDHDSYSRNPDPGSLHKWKTSLRAAQQYVICKAFRDNADLKSQGYDFSLSGLHGGKRWGARAVRQFYRGRVLLIRIINGAARRMVRVLEP